MGVGATPCRFAKLTLRASKTDNDNETRDSPLCNQWPPSPNLSPRIAEKRAIRGERRRNGRNADPGRRDGLLSALALGYILTPLQGSQDEAAASMPLHFLQNVQSPDKRLEAASTFDGWLAISQVTKCQRLPGSGESSPPNAAAQKHLLFATSVAILTRCCRNCPAIPAQCRWPDCRARSSLGN